MLFVDEEFANLRAGRESGLSKLLWKPCVRFCSTHYQYIRDRDGPRIVQVGIGMQDDSDGLRFQAAPSGGVAPAARAERAA